MVNERSRILKLLIECPNEALSIRQVSIRRKINYKTAYLSLKELEKEGVVSLKKQGNTTICAFNRMFNPSVFMVEDARRKEALKDKGLRVLYDRLARVEGQFILLLFGSYAKGKHTKGSDIDLLLITDHPSPVEEQAKLVPLDIHLTATTYAGFISMLRTKGFSVVSEAVQHNIILFGIEDFYRLIEHAR